MRTRFFGMAIAVVAAASVVAVSAQHREATHATARASAHQIPFHHLCASPDSAPGADAATADHTAKLAAALGLSAEQLTAVTRVTTEACAAMTRYHEQIMAVLTPEQRAKLHEMHGAGRDHLPPTTATRPHGGR